MLPNELDILKDVSEKLTRASIAYMLTGSLAMSYYAQPRMTRDIDVVIAVQMRDVDRIVALFSEDYYIAREAVEGAIKHLSMFNAIHEKSVIKVDFIVRKETAYRMVEFERRTKIQISGFETWIVSKEDLILSKLEWAKESRSEMQIMDIRNLMNFGFDEKYMEKWIEELGLASFWKELKDEGHSA